MPKKVKYVFFLIIAILLYFVLRNVNFNETYGIIKNINISLFSIAFFTIVIKYFFWNYRWMILVNKVKKIKYFSLFPILLAGAFTNTITPGARVGGEPLMAYYLGK